ncbi:hypothetical protein EPA93_32500 [Ktedonosporobacter rubrisoli]|uniref:HAD family hydrolase n=1 Tax=Ktedonosporobacter rubrisoli TaxID=2509675 RepID=A0A4P6JY89_KTERU|nr:hypothetical protein [Ktedonosporobacter rubrisoli]QBD80442.1 hypothetical protein EPA93_32500 [Ktedonosporobacter rubrisoli]
MSSIAIVDFDGVIVDMTLHAQRAKELAQAFALAQDADVASEQHRKAMRDFFYSERGFFNAGLFALDRLMDGCIVELTRLVQEYAKVVVVTSRPTFTRDVTLAWFYHHCPGFETIEFFFKDSSESELKTARWKAQIVTGFARNYETILFIDDDERNRQAIAALASSLHDIHITIKACL